MLNYICGHRVIFAKWLLFIVVLWNYKIIKFNTIFCLLDLYNIQQDFQFISLMFLKIEFINGFSFVNKDSTSTELYCRHCCRYDAIDWKHLDLPITLFNYCPRQQFFFVKSRFLSTTNRFIRIDEYMDFLYLKSVYLQIHFGLADFSDCCWTSHYRLNIINHIGSTI